MKTHIIIGLGTLKRPNMVRQTLASLAQLSVPENASVELVLVDNDPEGSTEPLAASFQTQFSFPLTYLIEKRRGIVFMRNCILNYAKTQKTTHLAFIDDDEMVSPDWLIRMMETKKAYTADVVVGRVARLLPEDTPAWIRKGKFFERPHIKTGTVRKAASTSNVLFDFKLIVLDYGLSFHPALNLSGSSDTFLFTEATRKGAKIVWLNDDLVQEWIPKSRMTVKWLLQRAYRHTNCRTLRKRLTHAYFHTFLAEGGYGLLHFLLFFLSVPVNIFRGKAGLVHTLRFFWKGLGSFAGLGGVVYQEYEQIHGE